MDRRRQGPLPWRCCALAALLVFAFGLPATAEEPLQLQPPATVAAPTVVTATDGATAGPVVVDQGEVLPEPAADMAAPPAASGGPTETSAKQPAGKKAAPPRSADLATALARRGDLTLRNSTLDGALFTISELWGINIVVGEVRGTVNGVFKDAPLREILDSILLSNGYSYRPVGQSLVVSPLSDLGQINPFFESATIPVRSADVDEVVEGARLLSTPQGQVRAIKSARSLFVLDFPDRVQMIRQFVASIDGASRGSAAGGAGIGQPLEVGYFHTQYIAAKAASETLQAVLSKAGRVGIMEKEDRLVVSDYPENLKMVDQVLKRIDRPRPQVRITALIYDLSLQDIEELGINWNSAVQGRYDADGNPQTAFDVDSVMKVPYFTPDPTGAATATGAALTFMNLSKTFDLTAVLLALQNANDARLVAAPHAVALDNEQAVFQSVSEIPYQQLTQTEAGGQIGTTAFKEAGISLRVRPKVAVDGTIQMDVMPEYSRLTGYTPGDNQPIIDRRTASTTLTVGNRQVVVIGGLRERSDVGDFKAVPYLKDIRWVGKLFRSRETDVRESELVVFIMPEIIGYDDKPNERQQAIVDTVDYRLNCIPEAEGRPPGCCGQPGCGPGAMPCGPPNCDVGPISGATGAAGRAGAAGGMTGPGTSAQTLVAQGRLRRLPTIDGSQPPLVVAPRPTELFSEPPAESSPLRPNYEARFRATGGVYRSQQRTVEHAPPSEPEVADKKQGFWDRVWRF